MLPGERRNLPSNLLESYSDMKMNEMIAQREYLRSDEGKEFVKQVGIEAALVAFPYAKTYRMVVPAPIRNEIATGITSLGAKAASLRGAPKVKGQGTIDDVFVNKPSYHGTSDPSRFERMGSKGNELGVEVPAPGQAPDLIGAGRSPSFSVSSDYNLAKEFANKPMAGEMAPRVIPTVLDKKYVKDILEWRNPSHKRYIAAEYRAERETIKKDLFKKDGTLRNDRTLAQEKNAFDKATSKSIKDLDDWDKTNWDVMETISDRLKNRGWKGYLTVEEGKLNLQVLDGKMIRGVKDKDTGQLMYNTPKALKELKDGGPVREGILTLPKPVNVRKKQVRMHKASKSLKDQGYSPEVRLKAQFKNTSYIG